MIRSRKRVCHTACLLLLSAAVGWSLPAQAEPEPGDETAQPRAEGAQSEAERARIQDNEVDLTPQEPRSLSDSSQGLRVFVDHETGELTTTPTPQQTWALSASLAKALSRSTEGLRVFDLPGGGKGVFLEGRFQYALVAKPSSDGTLELTCVDHQHQAEAALAAEASTTSAGAPRR